MNVVVIFAITLPLTTVGVLCASVSSLDVTNAKMAQWQSGSDTRHEKKDDQRLLPSSLLDGRGRLKRNSDDIRVYQSFLPALFTSPSTAFLQKHQKHRLRCPSWRPGERLSLAFWYRGSTLLARFLAPNERGSNFTDGERYQLDDKMGLIIQNVTDDDRGLYDCRVVPTATEKERKGMVTIEILDSTFPADDVSMVSINTKQNINRQNGGQIECPHSTTDAAATYWSLDKGEGIDTDIIGAEYSNKDNLVLDKFKEDYQIASGGDLEILLLQRPQSRFWCHRFQDGSMVVGYIDVTGVVVVNQDQPIITGCENWPGDICQVNFDPDKDLQLNCSTRKVYPKVTMAWREISKCDTNFQEASFERFDDVSKTYDQYQLLTVKAGSFAADCQPKFVCNATGVAIPVKPLSAEVIQVNSGVSRIVGLLVAVIFMIMILSLIVILIRLMRKGYFVKECPSSANVEANKVESDVKGRHLPCQEPVGKHSMLCTICVCQEPAVADHQNCDINNDEKSVKPDTQEHEAKQQPDDGGKTLLSQTSRSDELEPAEKEHIEIHPPDSNSFSPRKWLIQGHNIVVHIHQYVGHRTASRNAPKNSLPKKEHAKGGTTYQTVCMETDPELFSAGQQNLEVEMPENSSSPPLSKPRENDPQQMSFSGVACEHLHGQQQIELDEVLLHRQVSVEANSDPYLTQVEVYRQQEDPPEISISEAACEPLRKVVPQLQPQQHISDEANSDPHPVNRQQEDSQDISISEDEACPSDPLLGAPSETMTSTASDARGHKQSTATSKDLQEENQRSNGPGPSPVGLGNNSPKRGKSDGESPIKESKWKKKKKLSKTKKVPDEESDFFKPKGGGKQAARITRKPMDGNIADGTDEETESIEFGSDSGFGSSPSSHLSIQSDDAKDQPAAEERSTDHQQVAQHVDKNDCSAFPNPAGPLPDPTTNQHTDDVQHPHHRGVSTQKPDYNYPSTPAQQADQIMKQPSHFVNPFQTASIPAWDNPSEEEPEQNSIFVPDIPHNQTRMQPTSPPLYTSPGSNSIDRWLDYSPNMRTHEPSPPRSPQAPLAAQDDHSHVPLLVSPPQSDYSDTTPCVGLDSNGSTFPNRLPSDDKDMGSLKSDSGNEKENEAIHDASDDLGDNQQDEAPPIEVDKAIADEPQKVCPPADAKMRDSSEEEVVEHPTRERKERQSTANNLRKKQNPLITENILDKRTKALAVK